MKAFDGDAGKSTLCAPRWEHSMLSHLELSLVVCPFVTVLGHLGLSAGFCDSDLELNVLVDLFALNNSSKVLSHLNPQQPFLHILFKPNTD